MSKHVIISSDSTCDLSKELISCVSDRLADAEGICLDRVFVTHAGCDPKVVGSITEAVKKTHCPSKRFC